MTSPVADWCARALRGEPDVLKWYGCPPMDVVARAAERPADSVAPLDEAEAGEWGGWLRGHGGGEGAMAGIDKLRQPGALAVVTGQQAGLFGGPLFTLYKAAGAIHWAREIEEATGRPTVPIFWVASDDHDIDEVAVTSWLDKQGNLEVFRLAPGDTGRPVYAVDLPPGDLAALFARVEETTHPTDFRDGVLDRLRAAVEAPATFESQFTRILCSAFADLPLVPVAPRLGWMRRRAAGLVRRELETRGASAGWLRDAGDEIESLGPKGAVLHRRGNEANFFYHDEHERRLKAAWDGDELVLSTTGTESGEARHWSCGDALAEVERHPERFSPNAALRPLVQDTVLPTAAYIAGPSELVYHAQLRPLYDRFGVFRPAVTPRPSAVLVEPPLRRAADKLGLDVGAALRAPANELRAAAARAAAGDAADRVHGHLADMQSALDALLASVRDATPDTATRQAADRLREGFESGRLHLRERLDAALLKQSETTARQVQRILDHRAPNGAPQERTVGWIAPLLVKYGWDSIARVVAAIDHHGTILQLPDPSRDDTDNGPGQSAK